jgi:hypothetical protein
LNGARRAHRGAGCQLQRGAPLDGLGKIPVAFNHSGPGSDTFGRPRLPTSTRCTVNKSGVARAGPRRAPARVPASDGSWKSPGRVRPLRPVVRIRSDGPDCQLQPGAPLDGTSTSAGGVAIRTAQQDPGSRLPASTRCTAGRHPQDPGRVRPPPACGSDTLGRSRLSASTRCTAGRHRKSAGRVRPPPAAARIGCGSDGPANMMMMTSGSRRALISRHWWNRAPCPHLPEEPNGGLCCASCFPANSKIPGRARPPPAAARLGRSRLSASTRCTAGTPHPKKTREVRQRGERSPHLQGTRKSTPYRPRSTTPARGSVRIGPDCRLQPGAPLDGPGRSPAAFNHSGPGSDRFGRPRVERGASCAQGAGCRLQRGAPLDGLSKIPGCVRPLRPPVRIRSDGPACQLQPRAPLDGRPRCFGRFLEEPGRVHHHSGLWFGSDGPGCRLQPGAPLDGPARSRPRSTTSGLWFGSDRIGRSRLPASTRCTAGRHPQDPGRVRPPPAPVWISWESAGPAAGPCSGFLAMVHAAGRLLKTYPLPTFGDGFVLLR